MGRMKPGVTVEQAQAHARPEISPLRRQHGDDARADEPTCPILTLQPGANGLDSLRRQYSRPIYILMAMVGLILLVACSNIASLLLSRAAARRREIAVRMGIGASRARVVRQLVTESLLLASVGGALGIAVGWWGIGVLTQLLSNGRDNFTLHAELNWPVLGVTLVLSLATGVVFGLAPALQATRVDIAPALKEVRANDAPTPGFRTAPGPRAHRGPGRALAGAAGSRGPVRTFARPAASDRAGLRPGQRPALHDPAVQPSAIKERRCRGCSRRCGKT